MATVTYIAEKDAPTPPKALSKSAAETLKILQGIKDGQVARVTPDNGQTMRGLRASMSRVSKNQGMKIQSYETPDEPGVLYVKKTK